MKQSSVLHLTAVDFGGAGKFALDLNDLLLQMGYRSYLVAMDVKSDNPRVLRYPQKPFARFFRRALRRHAKNRLRKVQFDYDYYFYNVLEKYPKGSAKEILKLLTQKPEVIFLHWLTDFVNAKVIHDLYRFTGAKIYWIMIDNAPITGGCHYPWECRGYQTNCGNCPAIVSKKWKWLAEYNLALKLKYLPHQLSLVTGSQTEHLRASLSAIFKNKQIIKMLGFVDENKYQPGNKESARVYFNIPENKKVLFFGAASLKEKRKGMQLLLNAIEQLCMDGLLLLVAGNMQEMRIANRDVKMLGYLNEADLIKAYQAADAFVCPSVEDSGPMMINQSIMCGTPVIAFANGVALDLVINGQTGYRASKGDSNDLAIGIQNVLQLTKKEMEQMRLNCRNVALQNYSSSVIKNQLLELMEHHE